jgi:hypothetical protein
VALRWGVTVYYEKRLNREAEFHLEHKFVGSIEAGDAANRILAEGLFYRKMYQDHQVDMYVPASRIVSVEIRSVNVDE